MCVIYMREVTLPCIPGVRLGSYVGGGDMVLFVYDK